MVYVHTELIPQSYDMVRNTLRPGTYCFHYAACCHEVVRRSSRVQGTGGLSHNEANILSSPSEKPPLKKYALRVSTWKYCPHQPSIIFIGGNGSPKGI